MFVNTGSREIKKSMSVTFEYDPKDTYYSRKSIELILGNLRSYLNGSLYSLMEAVREKQTRFLSFLSEGQMKDLIELENKYEGRIFFSYDSPNKKKKTHTVNFYIVPLKAYGYVRADYKHRLAPYSNEKVFLKSNVKLPDTLVSGQSATEKFVTRRIKFVKEGFGGKNIPFKNIFNEVHKAMRFKFNEKVYELEQGLYPAIIDGVNCFFYIDKTFIGSPKDPEIILIESGLYTEKELSDFKEKGIYKEF